ncbi:hypothetical protein DDB_G0279101 [Dictyostelium discoideum AX4]|uniref:Uncharacterized protein n=1 Tax=Dictyostelium discoideum TaxID=44689 RepID=Q54XA1_DICDI|nr:hypothetical protein DDB_G0279101 [Dictyostelium discoideum AX4]EAL67889.1 hypothetical protein DDB_G0279101 [Dictyostelium discoideum AX4]|eukprot:XP_641866.1 hypothetical protein DDB_G0279101 [Dictyostelium discoideum AX4]
MGASNTKPSKSFISKRLEEATDILIDKFQPSIENVNMLSTSSNLTIDTYNELGKHLIYYSGVIFKLVIVLLILVIWVQIKLIMTDPWYNYPMIFFISILLYSKIKLK